MKATMVRTNYHRYGAFSVFSFDGRPIMVTLEPPWNNNQRNISCMPVGAYNAVRCNCSPEYSYGDSPKFGNTFVIENVPNRWQNVIHAGNIWTDTDGCILTGSNFGTLDGLPAVLNSRTAFLEFLSLTKDLNHFPLLITNHNPEINKGYWEPEGWEPKEDTD